MKCGEKYYLEINKVSVSYKITSSGSKQMKIVFLKTRGDKVMEQKKKRKK